MNYWCTWATQNYAHHVPGDPGPPIRPDDFATEKALFGPDGWARRALPDVRPDLLLMLDEGWDVPSGTDRDVDQDMFGAVLPPSDKFPSAGSGTPSARLRRLCEMADDCGWRGIGLWICAAALGENGSVRGAGVLLAPDVSEAYWWERARWSAEAGVAYWKVDWGVRAPDIEFRRMLTRICRAEAPGLMVEHASCYGPFNDEHGTGRFGHTDTAAAMRALLPFSDMVRTYDVSAQLSISTTLDRVATLLHDPPAPEGGQGLLNCEDEPYLGAALGCALGIMRSPFWKDPNGPDYDPLLARKRMAEVTRAVRWQAIAPPVAGHISPARLSAETLSDTWDFLPGETWADWVSGRRIVQTAPAIITRGNLPDPVIRNDSPDRPFLVASRHPDGPIALALLPRALRGPAPPPSCRVVLNLGRPAAELGGVPIGVFGECEAVTLRADTFWPATVRVTARDLASDSPQDITSRVHRDGAELTIPGDLLRTLCLSVQGPDDPSEPGCVLTITFDGFAMQKS